MSRRRTRTTTCPTSRACPHPTPSSVPASPAVVMSKTTSPSRSKVCYRMSTRRTLTVTLTACSARPISRRTVRAYPTIVKVTEASIPTKNDNIILIHIIHSASSRKIRPVLHRSPCSCALIRWELWTWQIIECCVRGRSWRRLRPWSWGWLTWLWCGNRCKCSPCGKMRSLFRRRRGINCWRSQRDRTCWCSGTTSVRSWHHKTLD